MSPHSFAANPGAFPARATRTRYLVVVFAIVLAVVQYIDRVAISQAKDGIAKELHFTDGQMGDRKSVV